MESQKSTKAAVLLALVVMTPLAMFESKVLLSRSYVVKDFLAVFALAHTKINQILEFFDEMIWEVSD